MSKRLIDESGRYIGWGAVTMNRRQARMFFWAYVVVIVALFIVEHWHVDWARWPIIFLLIVSWGGFRGADRYADGFRDGAHAVASGPPLPPDGAGLTPWTDQEWADLTSNDVRRMSAAITSQAFRQRAWERSQHE